MALIFYDQSNAVGDGSFFDRSNNADGSAGLASGGVGTVVASSPDSSALGYATVVLVAPIYTGPGSIAFSSNFTGTAVAGDTVRYPTTNGFVVHDDASVSATVNSGSYACFYNDGVTEEAFTVSLSGTAIVTGALPSVTSEFPNGTATGSTLGDASGAIATVTATAPNGSAVEASIAAGDVGTATSSALDGTGTSSQFGGSASGSITNVQASVINGNAVGFAEATCDLVTVTSVTLDGTVNEVGRGDASGDIATATVLEFDGRGRAQWGKVAPTTTIWTRAS